MTCPGCGKELEAMTLDDVTVDVCRSGCAGIWFDRFELEKFDEPHEETGLALLEIEKNPNVTVDRTQRMNCPRCPDITMFRHFFSVKREVAVDECPACAGFWLDFGELGQIRSQFRSEEERTAAAFEYFDEVFGERLAAMHAESEEKAEKARRIARIFRFICPSYYIPGKQEWGAF